MKRVLPLLMHFALFLLLSRMSYAAPDVTISTVPVAAGSINQGSSNNIIYIAKVTVTGSALTINSIDASLGGNFDNDDLNNILVYYYLTGPSLTGAIAGGNVPGSFASPHLFTIPAGRLVPAGTTLYILIVANASNTATDNHTVMIDGAVNPIIINSSSAPVLTNSQTDDAGAQTIQGADITVTTVSLGAADVNQGSSGNIIYIAKVDVATEPLTITSIVANLSGSFDIDDLTNISLYYNTSVPSLAGAVAGGNVTGNFAAPHLFTFPTGRVVAAGSTIYILIIANTGNTATDNHTIHINGAADPIVINTITAPNLTNNQTDAAGIQTIQAADITTSTVAIPAAGINPGTSNNIVYIAKMQTSTEPVTVTDIQADISGSFDNDDLVTVSIFYNLTAPNLIGALAGGNVTANFAAPHSFIIPSGRLIPAGTTAYILVLVNVAAAATDNHAVTINGGSNPLIINTTTAPNFTNNQTNTAGIQTIQASDIILSTVTLPAANIMPGSANNIVYILKMDVGTSPVTISNLQCTLGGTYTNSDLSNMAVLFNANNPTIAGASAFGSVNANVDGPHTFTIPAGRLLPAGTTNYFLFTVNVNAGATENHSVLVNGATDPVVFSFTTLPNVNNSQSNSAGVFNISSVTLPLTLQSFTAQKITGNRVQLQWTTTTEINTKNFEVQWSINGINYSSFDIVAAQGNNSSDKHYQITHLTSSAGINYYRLKMVDLNGQFSYSPVVMVMISHAGNSITLAPNPVSSQLRLVLNGTLAIKSLRIYNVCGQTIWQSNSVVNRGVIPISMAAFSTGLYTVEVTSVSGIERIPFIKAGQ